MVLHKNEATSAAGLLIKFDNKSPDGICLFAKHRDARRLFDYALLAICMPLPPYLRAQPDGVFLAIKLQPRASVNEIGEPLGNELRIKVTAPPVDSAANEALVCFLAETLGCPRNRVELMRGHTSRHKVVKLHGLSPDQVLSRLRPV
jgi:uncharacterized protein (TIGR00251 family)